jgi:hypothetical protein
MASIFKIKKYNNPPALEVSKVGNNVCLSVVSCLPTFFCAPENNNQSAMMTADKARAATKVAKQENNVRRENEMALLRPALTTQLNGIVNKACLAGHDTALWWPRMTPVTLELGLAILIQYDTTVHADHVKICW